MSSRSEAPIAAINAALDDLVDVYPTYQNLTERKARLVAISQVIAKAEADRLRVLAVSEDIAVETGARTTAHWLADQTRDGIGQVRLRDKIARHPGHRIVEAMSHGAVQVAQAREIVEALDRLPKH